MDILWGIMYGGLFIEQGVLYFPETGSEFNNHSLR